MSDKSAPSQGSAPPDILRHTTPRRLKLIGIVVLVTATAIVVVGLVLRFNSGVKTRAWTEDVEIETVRTIQLQGVKGGGDFILPGEVQAFTNAPIYAQVSGTIEKWYTDIGTSVKAGALLAEIDPHPYQAALNSAKGQLVRDSATLTNARTDLQRYQTLAAQNAISNQQLATQEATVLADSGIVTTDQANVDTAAINLGYTRIVAPFGGIVTSRSVDVGNLVTVGTASTTPLFTVTDEKRLRVYVQVPQTYSSLITPGMTVNFTVPQYPGRNFVAQLVASANAVSAQSGTQLVQFQIDNSDGALKPGDYAEMHFARVAAGVIRVPATTLLFRDSGMMVATVDSTSHVVLKPVVIENDLGTAVEVSSGLLLSDHVIDNPPDSIQAGDLVHVAGDTSARVLSDKL